MVNLITYGLIVFGVAYIVGHSTISLPIRRWVSWFGRYHSSCERCGRIASEGIDMVSFDRDGALEYTQHAQCHCMVLPFRAYWKPWKSVRLLLQLIECPACLGTHIGFWITLFDPQLPTTLCPWIIPFCDSRFMLAVVMGSLTAGINTLLGYLTGIMHNE